MAFARTVADRMVFMHDGEIVEQGPPSQILDNPQQERTRSFVNQILNHSAAENHTSSDPIAAAAAAGQEIS